MLSRSERFEVQTATKEAGNVSRDFEGVTVPSWSAWRSTFWVPRGNLPISSTSRRPRFAWRSFPGFEDEGAHRVPDLLELAEVDVAGQMVGKTSELP